MSPIFSELTNIVQKAASVNLYSNTIFKDPTIMSEHPKLPAMSPDSPPTKRKRGRPPKATSLTSQITTRINISVNTSPTNSSPIAESNSNRIVKQGAPDCFTPLMRVSPSRKKKRRPSSTSTTPKRLKGKGLVSPVSVGTENNNNSYSPYTQINSKTLDNISFITQSDAQIYHTPPNTAYVPSPKKIHTPKFMPPVSSGSDHHQNLVITSNSGDAAKGLLPSAAMSYPKTKIETTDMNYSNEQDEVQKPSKSKSGDFPLKLMVDNMGKAVLYTDFLSSSKNEELVQPVSSSDEPDSNKASEEEAVDITGENTNSALSLNSTETAVNEYSSFQSSIPNSNSSQGVLRRFNSDITAYTSSSNSIAWTANELPQSSDKLPTLPQTPKLKDNYFYSTGFTPTNNISFNLTPQFNSMMYSTMNLNSPQRRKDTTNHSQFLMNQDFFMNGTQGHGVHAPSGQSNNTINMSEFMNMTGSSSSQNKQDSQRAPLFNANLMPSSSSSATSMASDDSGDARFALKKIMYIKRK